MRLLVTLIAAALITTAPAFSDNRAIVDRYYSALKMNEVFKILHDEGVASAIEMAKEDDGITQSPAWTSRVKALPLTIESRGIPRGLIL